MKQDLNVEILLVKDIMEILHITKPTAYKLIREGKIRALNLGTYIRPQYRILKSQFIEDLAKLNTSI